MRLQQHNPPYACVDPCRLLSDGAHTVLWQPWLPPFLLSSPSQVGGERLGHRLPALPHRHQARGGGGGHATWRFRLPAKRGAGGGHVPWGLLGGRERDWLLPGLSLGLGLSEP